MSLIDTSIAFAHRRLRLERGARFALATLVVASALAVVGLLVFRLWPVYVVRGWELAALPLLALVAGVAGFLSCRRTRMQAAIELDRRLQLSEQSSSAYAFASIAPSEQHVSPDVLACLRSRAESRLGRIDRGQLRRAFPLPGRTLLIIVVAVVAVAWFLVPLAPSLMAVPVSAAAQEEQAQAKEKQAVREQARQLARRAAEAERSAELHKLEALRLAAAQVRNAAEEMSKRPILTREAMARLSKLSEAIDQSKADALGRDLQADPFGMQQDLDQMSEILAQLDKLGLSTLAQDFEQFREQLRAEAQEAEREQRPLELDAQQLDQLCERIDQAEQALSRLDTLMARNPELAQQLAELNERQRAALEKIRKELERLCQASRENPQGCESGEAQACTQLDALSAEDLEALATALAELEALEALEQACEQCKGGMASGKGSPSGALGEGEGGAGQGMGRLAQALRRIASMRGQGGKGDSSLSQGGGQGGPGQGEGGQAPRGEDDGRGEESSKVQGQLDSKGRFLNEKKFKGVPRPNDVTGEFEQTVADAVADAEQSLEREDIPADMRPYVRRYFDALKQDESGKGGSSGK